MVFIGFPLFSGWKVVSVKAIKVAKVQHRSQPWILTLGYYMFLPKYTLKFTLHEGHNKTQVRILDWPNLLFPTSVYVLQRNKYTMRYVE